MVSNSRSTVIDLPEKFYAKTADFLKYASLATLTLQNAAVSLTIRYARTRKELFIPSTAVFLGEVIKLITCLFMVRVEEGSFKKSIRIMRQQIIEKPMETAMVGLPSLVYYIQNNLIYIGATHLDAATCQVTYQLKILTTAMFSIFMLNKRLHAHQWLALVLLFIGVAVVQLETLSKQPVAVNGTSKHDLSSNNKAKSEHVNSPVIGFVAILLATCSSGFAGVYFERVLKGNTEISLWIRNVQLSMLSLPVGLLQIVLLDRGEINEKGFFYGYSLITWIVIMLQAQGGLLCAVVVKYADNILKGFATSLAIIISCVISIYLFDFHMTLSFLFGSTLVISATFLYGKQVKPKFDHHQDQQKL